MLKRYDSALCDHMRKVDITPQLYGMYGSSTFFMYNDEKWSDILLESCGVNSVRILKYVWPFFIIMHEMGNYNNRKRKTFD